MKFPHLAKQHYELLWIGLLSVVILALIIILIKDDLFRESVIENNWEIVHDETSSRTDKINALYYLAKQKETLGKLDFSTAKILFQGLDLSAETLELNKGVDLRNIYLSKINLSDANLSEADLGNADLSKANLTDARLHDVNLSDANLTSANLTGANFSGANFSGANLTGANLYSTNLLASKLTNANLSDANLFAVNLTSADFSGAILNEGTVINYGWIWETTDQEEHPTAYLPVGIPENWDITLKPDYVCKKSSGISDAQAPIDEIKMKIEKRCKPYVPPVEPETPQEEPSDL